MIYYNKQIWDAKKLNMSENINIPPFLICSEMNVAWKVLEQQNQLNFKVVQFNIVFLYITLRMLLP